MTIQREWVTPVTMGAFLIVAVTGVLMFFHLDTGLNKVAHEWLGWLLLASVILHAVVNIGAFKRHLNARLGKALLAVFVLLLLLSFVSPGDKREPPFAAPVRALAETSLSNLAMVAGTTPAEMRQRLMRAGLQPVSDRQSLSDLVGPDQKRQMHLLSELLGQRK